MTDRGNEGGPAGLGLMEWLMNGRVDPEHRARAVKALDKDGLTLAQAIGSFEKHGPKQEEVIANLVDAAEKFQAANPEDAILVWRQVLAWLKGGGTVTWSEHPARRWRVVLAEDEPDPRNLHVTVFRPDAEACPPVPVSNDLFK